MHVCNVHFFICSSLKSIAFLHHLLFFFQLHHITLSLSLMLSSNLRQNFVRQLLVRDPNARLGCEALGGFALLRQHAFFEGVCVCVCVFMYVCVHVCMCMWSYVCTYIYIYLCV